jgi:hypothetical protein
MVNQVDEVVPFGNLGDDEVDVFAGDFMEQVARAGADEARRYEH